MRFQLRANGCFEFITQPNRARASDSVQNRDFGKSNTDLVSGMVRFDGEALSRASTQMMSCDLSGRSRLISDDWSKHFREASLIFS